MEKNIYICLKGRLGGEKKVKKTKTIKIRAFKNWFLKVKNDYHKNDSHKKLSFDKK